VGHLNHLGQLLVAGLWKCSNIGDFDLAEDDSPFFDIEGTVNLFASNARPTTLDIDETAVIAVTIPYEGELGPLLQHIAKYYSPMSGKYFKFCLKLKLNILDNNNRIYILDLQKHRWIVKGRFRDALQFQDSVAQFWQKTEFGPTLTIFLEVTLRLPQPYHPLFFLIGPPPCQSLILGRLIHLQFLL